MSYYIVKCSISNDSALARDLSVNTLHYATNNVGTDAQERSDIDFAVNAFYTNVDNYLSANVGTTGALRVQMYDHEDAPPRVPVFDTTHNLTPDTSALPNEVAICISFRENPMSGIRRQRQRGRIYFGPVSAATMSDTTGDMFVDGATRTALADNMHDFLFTFVGAVSGSTLSFCVFSAYHALDLPVGSPGPPADHTYTASELARGYREVDMCYVDDAFDTQRRRGLPARTRTVGA